MPAPSPSSPRAESAGAARRRQAVRRGRLAERLAAWLLRLKGYQVLGRNLALPQGEIDLLVRRGNILVVVEVKQRPDLAAALDAVSPRQRARLQRAALAVLARRPDLGRCQIRFDIVAVTPWPRHLADAWRP